MSFQKKNMILDYQNRFLKPAKASFNSATRI